MELAAERAKRWWQTRPPVRTIQRAAAFVDDVGLALLFPARGVELPSLYNAASERLADNLWTVEWGPEAERVWQWKDELPLGGRAWYGKFLGGRASLLSPALLADLYPRSGRPDDFTKAPLGEDARRIAEVVLLSGPTSTAALREELGLDGKKGQARFSRALAELGRHLVVTNFGVEDHGPGWPAAVLELTARAFAVPSSGRPGERRLAAARTFLQTTLSCRDADVARAFAWTRRDARAQLEDLVARDEATSEDGLYRPARRRRR